MTQTAAEKYAELKEKNFHEFLERSFTKEALKDVQLFEVTASSGMKFKCRKLGIDYQANGGDLPMALSESVVVGKSGDTEAGLVRAFSAMSEEQKIASLRASGRMLLYIAVEPRLIVGSVAGRKDAISVTDPDGLTMADANTLLLWAKSGGTEASGLKTFRSKRK